MKDDYNDGIVYFYKKRNIEGSFKSSKNTTNMDDLEYVLKNYFKEETQRQQDIVFAGAMDRKLSLKISVPYNNMIKSNYQVIINDYLYSIFHVDPDKGKNKTYIYLEGMRTIER